MRDDFEKSVTYLLPVDPYSKNKANNTNRNRTPTVSALKNASHSNRGVDLRWHTPAEYAKLTKEQRQELYHWHQSKEGKAKIAKEHASKSSSNQNSNKLTKKQLQARVKALEAKNASGGSSGGESEGSTIGGLSAVIAETVESEKKASAKRKVTFDPNSKEGKYTIAAQKIQKIIKRKTDKK